ncbi:hypothetical protein DMN91_002915 [Ooceraea biroi]|uniref:Protein msta n=1 Tax=Ooceraea biroi TaxID=2015173 RepID=A0A3L8DXL1_OOCBI|nr:hypothetical protein DMN91_002915 [Ooceraea biroi]
METDLSRGVCPVCGKNATLKCGNCKREFYCGKSHQSRDWPRHKSTCCAWRIDRDPDLGRHLLAIRDLAPGDVVLSEPPLVWGPSIHTTNQRLCVGCGKRCDDFNVRCGKCCWPVCKSNCEGLSDKRRHELECALLARARIIPRCEVLLVIRMLILWRTKSKRWTSLANLQSHEDSRRPGTEAHDEVLGIIQHLGPLLTMASDCMDVLPKICGLIDVNALETVPPEGSVAIYETASLLEHSCMANTRHSFHVDDKGRPRITVYAVTSIKKGEHLSTMYTHALWSTRARREHLLATKLTVLLHPGHQHCISVSHSLIQLLPASDPRKLDLCKRIMDTVNRLDPYGARLALYTAVVLRELAVCPGEDRQVHLTRAASLLKMEPPNSPGEKLLRLIEMELGGS